MWLPRTRPLKWWEERDALAFLPKAAAAAAAFLSVSNQSAEKCSPVPCRAPGLWVPHLLGCRERDTLPHPLPPRLRDNQHRTAWKSPREGAVTPIPAQSPPGQGGCSSPISCPIHGGPSRQHRSPGSAAGSPPCLSLPNSSGTKENKTPPAKRFIGRFPSGFVQILRHRGQDAAPLEGGQGHGARRRWQSGCHPADLALPVPRLSVPSTLPVPWSCAEMKSHPKAVPS